MSEAKLGNLRHALCNTICCVPCYSVSELFQGFLKIIGAYDACEVS